jgi:predicted MFS family arabinose efflux permease
VLTENPSDVTAASSTLLLPQLRNDRAGVYYPIGVKFFWQMTFLLSSIPTFVILFFVIFFVKEPSLGVQPGKEGQITPKIKYTDVFKYRNVIFCLFMCVLGLSGYWTMMIFAPVYLVNVSHFNIQSMGWVTAAMGILLFVYNIVVPKLSDNLGRKPVLFTALILAIISPLFMYLFPGTTLSSYTYVFFFGFTGAVVPIYMTMLPMESVPVTMIATVGALVQGTGDLLGAAVWPVIAGKIADTAGLPTMMLISAILMIITVILSRFIIETRPPKAKETGIPAK